MHPSDAALANCRTGQAPIYVTVDALVSELLVRSTNKGPCETKDMPDRGISIHTEPDIRGQTYEPFQLCDIHIVPMRRWRAAEKELASL